MHERTHASFFSGVGGLDLGLERAGWRTVSFSEIDPYASAVLAERWPDVPNLGDITHAATNDRWDRELRQGRAHLWTGGFPCQDLSVAGKRRGMVEGTRSNLAHAFLDLVERHRPPAVLLENVPGLLSSHRGRDMAVLLGRMAELGYGVAYRVLDARYFGVPQRRRRVFILGLRSDPDDPTGRVAAERAAAVLSVGTRCERHPPTGVEAGSGVAAGARPGVDIARAITGTSGKRHDDDTDTLIASPADDARGQGGRRQGSAAVGEHEPNDGRIADADAVRRAERASPDPHRVRAPDGLAGRSYDRGGVVNALDQRRGGPDDNEAQAGHIVVSGFDTADDTLLPLGLDSHRYRCCGNGVVAPVAEWIGQRLAEALR